MSLTGFINFIHLVFLFAPFMFIFINQKILRKNTLLVKIVFLFYLLTPLHWAFFDDKCILTLFSRNQGDYENSRNTIGFTDANLKPVYKPIMDVIGWDWNNVKDVSKMIYLHWIVIFIILWYIVCFRVSKN